MKNLIIVITALLSLCLPGNVFSQATINNGNNVSAYIPVRSWETYNHKGSDPWGSFNMEFDEKYPYNKEYKIELVQDAPYLVQNVVMFLMNPDENTSGVIESEEVFTYTHSAVSFNFSFDVPSSSPVGQTQLLKFKIYERVLGLWDWQTTFYYYVNTTCLNSWNFNNFTTLNSADYEASNALTVETTVKPNGGLAEFDAGNSVTLLPDFRSDLSAGGSISVIIDGCGGAFRLANPEINSIESLEELSKVNAVNIYPNPSSGKFSIALPSNEKTLIEVYDMKGGKVFSGESESELHELNLTDYPKGVYIVNIISNSNQCSKKIVLE